MGYNIWPVFDIFYNGVSLHLSLSQGQTIILANLPKGNSLWYFINLTTIPVEPNIQTESGLLKLKTCSLYHENFLLQKFNDMYLYTQVLTYFFSASDILEAVWGCFRFYGMNGI